MEKETPGSMSDQGLKQGYRHLEHSPKKANNRVVKAALEYAAKGRPVFPCKPDSKRPFTENGFKDATTDPGTIRQWWKQWPAAMIGSPTGNGVFVLDVDLPAGPDSLAALEQKHGPLPTTRESRTASGGRHLIFKGDARTSAGKLSQDLDIRGSGGYVIFPPSINTEGQAYTWTQEAPAAPAPDWLIDAISEATTRPAPTQKTGDGRPGDDFNERGDVRPILERHGWRFFRSAGAFERWTRPGKDTGPIASIFEDGSLFVFSGSAPPFESNRRYSPFAAYALLEHGNDYTAAAAALRREGYGEQFPLEQTKAPENHRGTDEDPPRALPDELLPVAAFDYALLPASLRDWCKDISERMQCPPDFVAVGLMTALGSVLGRRIGIRPQEKTDWTEVANLWGLIVGRPGLLKTPALDAAMGPLNRLIAQAQNEYQRGLAEYEKTKEAEQLRAAARKKQAAERLKENPDADLSDLQSPDLEPPAIQRYKSNDPSPAALAELLRHAPNGMMVFRDEMVSLFNSLEREDSAEGRGFYLTAWGGNSPFTSDRIGRGFNLHIPAICLSLLGGTQPSKLGPYIRQAVNGGTGDDGLLQRFGLLVWPDTNQTWQNIDRPTDKTAKNAAYKVFDYLDKLNPSEIGAEQDRDFDGTPDGIPYLRFSPEALEVFVEWRTELENLKLRGSDHPALVSHFSKYRKLVPSLALLIHLADGGKGPVALHPTLQALAWADYLETHARRAYGAVFQPEVAAAKAILHRIKKEDLPATFKARDVYRSGWAGLSERQAVMDALTLLVDHGYLAEEQEQTGGRPTTVYQLKEVAR